MTTQDDNLHIRVRETGSEQTRRQLLGVRGAITGVGGAARGIFSPLLGGSLLAGVLGGSLLAVAFSGGAASNSIIVLQSVIEDLLRPLINCSSPWWTPLPR